MPISPSANKESGLGSSFSGSGVRESDGFYIDDGKTSVETRLVLPSAISNLATCPRLPNRHTNHIRLPNPSYNISMNPRPGTLDEKRILWNPTIIALPSWAKNQYMIVSMSRLTAIPKDIMSYVKPTFAMQDPTAPKQ
jgi:hypothetical protein